MSQKKPKNEADSTQDASKNTEKVPKSTKNSQSGPSEGEKELETQQIKFLRSHPLYAYWPGETANLMAEHVTLLVEGGFAELVVADTEPEE